MIDNYSTIDREATFKKHGHYPEDIAAGSKKLVVVRCPECGKRRSIEKHNVVNTKHCAKCATKLTASTFNRRKKGSIDVEAESFRAGLEGEHQKPLPCVLCSELTTHRLEGSREERVRPLCPGHCRETFYRNLHEINGRNGNREIYLQGVVVC